MKQQVEETRLFLVEKGIGKIDLAIILGTGLGALVNEIEDQIVIEYQKIPNFPTATVEFHSGKLIYGKIHGKFVLAMQGRFHYYEGYSMHQITFPIRVMNALAVKTLLVSNAAGAVNLNFKKGELMLLKDHINLLPESPLRGSNEESWGPRFPDMSEPYSMRINHSLISLAKQLKIQLHEGVYASVQGPNLETAAEYRMLGRIGADAVGMSTVPEVIVANHSGIATVAISVLTDECNPDFLEPVDIEDIIKVAGIAEKKLIMLIKSWIELI